MANHLTEEQKEAKRARRRELYALNPRKMIEKSQRFYLRNKDKVLKKQKESRALNREDILRRRKEYRNKNRAMLNAKAREYAASNRQKTKESFLRWSNKNKTKLIQKRKEKWASDVDNNRARSRKYYADNRERLSAYSRCWSNKNRDKVRERERRYLQKNRAKVYAKIANREAKKKELSHPDSCASKIQSIYSEAKRLTIITGIEHEVDHIIPTAKRGWHHEENLSPLPGGINASKNDNPFWLAPSPAYKDWRDVPRHLWPTDLAPKYLALIEQNKGLSIRWDTAA